MKRLIILLLCSLSMVNAMYNLTNDDEYNALMQKKSNQKAIDNNNYSIDLTVNQECYKVKHTFTKDEKYKIYRLRFKYNINGINPYNITELTLEPFHYHITTIKRYNLNEDYYNQTFTLNDDNSLSVYFHKYRSYRSAERLLKKILKHHKSKSSNNYDSQLKFILYSDYTYKGIINFDYNDVSNQIEQCNKILDN